MKRFKTWLCFAMLAIMMFTSSFSYISKPQCKEVGDSFLILDSNKVEGLPDQGYRMK